MLIQLVQKINAQISNLDVDKSVADFAAEVRRRNPESRSKIVEGMMQLKAAKPGAYDQVADAVILVLCRRALELIKDIPASTTRMMEALQSQRSEPAFKFAVASVLAYLVQPRDLIPDDAPGGYGFLDDAVVVFAAHLDFVSGSLSETDSKEYLASLRFLTNLAPPEAVPLLQQSVQGMERMMAMSRMLPADMLQFTTNMIIANPIALTQGTAGMRGASTIGSFTGAQRPRYTWSDGNTLAVNFPGGGGVYADASGVYSL